MKNSNPEFTIYHKINQHRDSGQ